jgi:hypothetical protein
VSGNGNFVPTPAFYLPLILVVTVLQETTQPRRTEIWLKGQECTVSRRTEAGCGSAIFDPFKTFTELSHYFIIASVTMKWTSSMLYQTMLEYDGEDEIAAKKDN